MRRQRLRLRQTVLENPLHPIAPCDDCRPGMPTRTPEAKQRLASTIRALRERLLADVRSEAERRYKRRSSMGGLRRRLHNLLGFQPKRVFIRVCGGLTVCLVGA